MQYRILHDSDREALEGFLCNHTASSMFLRNNLRIAGVVRRRHPLSATWYGAVDEKGAIHGVVAHMVQGNVLVQAPDQDIRANLARLLKDDLAGAPKALAGILGPDDQVLDLIDRLGQQGQAFAVNRAEGLYQLDLADLVIPAHPLADAFQIVDAARVDRETLLRWMRAYEIEALGAEESPALDAKVAGRLIRAIEDRCWWVLCADGMPVSLCGFNATLPDIVQLGPVWTPVSQRNKGYARACVVRTLMSARARGIRQAVLFTDNQPAIRAYEALGFEKTDNYRLAIFSGR
jgi:predicted GNAT family acetyltransferase